MMHTDKTTASSIINDATIQRYHDGESPPSESRAVAEMLMRDATLRASMGKYRRIDELAERALAEPGKQATRVETRRRIRVALPIAACMALAGALIVSLIGTDPLTQIDSPTDLASRQFHIEAVPTTSSAYRVVVSFPALAPALSAPAVAPAEPMLDVDRIADFLSAGRVDEALAALSALPVAEHGELWGRVAVHMRSADLARSSMLLLPVDQQVEIVRVWANEPSLRPVVFERLRELLRDPDAAPAARILRDALAQNPATRSWVSSYAAR